MMWTFNGSSSTVTTTISIMTATNVFIPLFSTSIGGGLSCPGDNKQYTHRQSKISKQKKSLISLSVSPTQVLLPLPVVLPFITSVGNITTITSSIAARS